MRKLRDRFDFTIPALGFVIFLLGAAAESFTGVIVGLVIMALGAFES